VVGDIVSLTARAVPCNVLLLAGSAVVNEAMLPVESVPQIKTAVEDAVSGGSREQGANDDDDGGVAAKLLTTRLDMEEFVHKESIVFSGNVVVDVRPPPDQRIVVKDNNDNGDNGNNTNKNNHQNEKAYSFCPVPRPQNGDCMTFVLRTRFERQQEYLLRIMIHDGNGVDGVNTRDTFVFMLLLPA